MDAAQAAVNAASTLPRELLVNEDCLSNRTIRSQWRQLRCLPARPVCEQRGSRRHDRHDRARVPLQTRLAPCDTDVEVHPHRRGGSSYVRHRIRYLLVNSARVASDSSEALRVLRPVYRVALLPRGRGGKARMH